MKTFKIRKPTHLLLTPDGCEYGRIQTRGRAMASMCVNLADGRRATTASTSCVYDTTGYFNGRATTPDSPLCYLFGDNEWPELTVSPVAKV